MLDMQGVARDLLWGIEVTRDLRDSLVVPIFFSLTCVPSSARRALL